MNPINVICIKWGTLYSPAYVNRLKNMVCINSTYPIKFHCFTEKSEGLDSDIIVKPIPSIEVEPNGCFKRETAFFSPNLGDLQGQRVFYFDLDTLIVNNLDELFQYPTDDKFYIIEDWASSNKQVGQGSCFSWVISDRYNFITTDYVENKEAIDKKYGTASQEYLSDRIINIQSKLKFWPKEWFCSFRFHCLPHPLLRYFKTATIPNKDIMKVVVFHGNPNPDDALAGRWPDKKKHKWKVWKKLYKHTRPTHWIKNYWK